MSVSYNWWVREGFFAVGGGLERFYGDALSNFYDGSNSLILALYLTSQFIPVLRSLAQASTESPLGVLFLCLFAYANADTRQSCRNFDHYFM